MSLAGKGPARLECYYKPNNRLELYFGLFVWFGNFVRQRNDVEITLAVIFQTDANCSCCVFLVEVAAEVVDVEDWLAFFVDDYGYCHDGTFVVVGYGVAIGVVEDLLFSWVRAVHG